MRLKTTRAPGASQARFCTPNPHADATRRSRLKFVWLEQLKTLVAEEAGRNGCKIQKVSHRLVCDLAETVARYPSFTQHGAVWAGQAPLAEDDHRVSPSAEYRTPTSPNHRATASSNSREEELKKDSSPVGPSGAAQATQRQAEGDELDLTQNTTGEAVASAPASQPSFARLFDDYPHPPGVVEIPAYYGHARKAWNKLSTEQKQSAQLTGRKALGDRWLGYWLDDGRETGEFRVAARHTDRAAVWRCEGTPEFEAWRENYRANGRRLPTIQHRVGGQLQTGWMFESEWPPNFNFVQRDGGAA